MASDQLKLAYIILAHDRPDQVAELARVLAGNGRDTRAYVHFDANAPASRTALLETSLAEDPKTEMVQPRVVTGWGCFGLVDSVVKAIGQIARSDFEPDYVVLLSGADLPVRPVAQMERFLAARRGEEFIEVYDSSWILDGLRESRHQLYFPFNMRKHPRLHRGAERLQRLLGVRRRFPAGLTPRFGSQWWALTWDTCRAVQSYVREHPDHYRFFRSVWIPDEMFFQTLVHKLVPESQIAGHGLTHYQFTDKGKPVVYHDDHTDYLLSLERFFVRKCDPDAARLRARCLAEAAKPDNGAQPDPARSRRDDYTVKIAAQTDYPEPGHVFFRDHQRGAGATAGMAARLVGPLVVLTGPRGATDRLADALDGEPFQVIGEVFAPDAVEFRHGVETWHGLRRSDAAIRDLHPMLYLHRVLKRCDGRVPVLVWSWRRHGALLAALADNPAVTLVNAAPATGAVESAEALCYAADIDRTAVGDLARQPPVAGDGESLRRARLDALGQRTGFAGVRQALHETGRSGTVSVPWSFDPSAAAPDSHARTFETSIATAAGRGAAWFDSLTARLREAAIRQLWAAERPVLWDPAEAERIRRAAAALDPYAVGSTASQDGVQTSIPGAAGPRMAS